MDRQILNFTANEQILVCDNPIKISTNKVNYIEARFDLGQNWSGYDSVRAVWFNDFQCISTVLDSQGVTFVPFEVMKRKGNVKVNLVGSISENDVLTDRLTSYPVVAVIVDCIAQITGAETNPITPSQFEQFVAAVISEVEKVTGMTAQAETLPAGSQATARYENGILYLGIPQGIQGERGETGADGNGIASVVYNADYTLTLVFTNGERFTTPPIRGERGPAGTDGRDGTNGRDGADGVTPNLSIGTVTTLPATEDAYVTRTGTDENPVFDFGIPQGLKGDKGDTGEVSLEQLSELLPTDTASGAIASFPDGTDLFPALSVKAQIEPIQGGSGTPSPDNVRPISGHTECVTSVSGVNVWDEEWEVGGIRTADGTTTSSNAVRSKNFSKIIGNTSYYVKAPNDVYVFFYGADYGYITYTALHNGAFTSPQNASYFKIQITSTYGTTYNHDISINYPSTDHDYHAYDGHTYTTTLGRTVYGGTLDVVSGELTLTHGAVTFDGTNGTYSFLSSGRVNIDYADLGYKHEVNALIGLSNLYTEVGQKGTNSQFDTLVASMDGVFDFNNTLTASAIRIKDSRFTSLDTAKGILANTPLQVVYELATPQTYQLTPQEVQTLLGDNNIWSDGQVEVVYKADIQRWVLKKLSE